jgi:hypothetical protein
LVGSCLDRIFKIPKKIGRDKHSSMLHLVSKKLRQKIIVKGKRSSLFHHSVSGEGKKGFKNWLKEHERSGKEINTLLEASYQGQNVTFELWHSTAKAKEGHVRLTTPFEALAKVYAEYRWLC